MDKIDQEKASMFDIAEKVNELVDFVNQYQKEKILELEMKINSIQYGKRMTDVEVIEDMRRRCGTGRGA